MPIPTGKKFPPDFNPRGTIKPNDKLLIYNSDTDTDEYALVSEFQQVVTQEAIGTAIGGATAITSIEDADKVAVTVSNVLKTLSWAYVKSILKTYLDGLYQAILTFGIADTNKVQINSATVANGEYAKFTASGLESRSAAEVLSDIAAEASANKSTNVITDGSSDAKYPSVKAIKDYADGLVTGLLNDRGNYDASTNVFPSTGGSGSAGAILKGDLWYISVAGTLGGVAVSVSSSLRSLIDTPGQTASNWNILGYTVENEVTDTSCFLLFATDATGRLSPKTNAGLIFNSNTGLLTIVQLSSGKINITTGDAVTYGTLNLQLPVGLNVGAGLSTRLAADQSIIQFGNNYQAHYTGPIDSSKAGVMIRLDTRNGAGGTAYGGAAYTLFQLQTRVAGTTTSQIPFQVCAAPTGCLIIPASGQLIVTFGLTTPAAIISTLATGTAPFTIASATLNTNLNADLLDGKHASEFQVAMSWSVVTSDGNLAVDTGTLANKGTLLTLTLPTTAAVGKVISVAGMNAGLWRIAQNANQIIHFGSTNTTTGAGGYLESTLAYDTVELVCVVANLEFVVKSSIGNITIN